MMAADNLGEPHSARFLPPSENILMDDVGSLVVTPSLIRLPRPIQGHPASPRSRQSHRNWRRG